MTARTTKRKPVPSVTIGPGAPAVQDPQQSDVLPPPLLGRPDTIAGEIVRDLDDEPRTWICTFMPAAWMRAGGDIVPLGNRYVRLHGTYEDVRQRMTAMFPGIWQFQHRSAVTAGVDALGLVELEVTS